MNDLNFCPACGKNLPVGATYCPACGNSLNGQSASSGYAEFEKGKNIDRTKIATALLLISAATAIIGGLWLYFNATGFMDQFIDAYPQYKDMFSGWTSIIKVSGLISVIAGVISIVAAWLAFKRKAWDVTVILCIIVALLGNLLFGLIALWLIWKARPVFEVKDKTQGIYR